MACELDTVLDSACTSGIGKVTSEITLLQIIAQNLCDFGGGTTTVPGGSDTDVQFNDAGAFGGDSDFTWNKTTNLLGVVGKIGITAAANANAMAVTGYSLTGANAQSLLSLAGTWNTSGTPSAILLNITNTASNAASKLLNLQIASVSQFSVDATGNLFVLDSIGVGTAPLAIPGRIDCTYLSANGYVVTADSYRSANDFVSGTVTAGGTTGNQIIDKPCGTVNFAGGASALTVTCNKCTVNSIVLAEVRTNDTTSQIKNVIPGAGSFVINLVTAATAETSVGFSITTAF